MQILQTDRKLVSYIRDVYKQGDRVQLIRMKDEPQMARGLRGTVTKVDDIGQIHVNWDSGSTLALVLVEDDFVKIDKFN